MSSNTESLAEKTVPSPDLESASGKPDYSDNNMEDPNVVDWDGPNDPSNPLNWPARMRWIHIIVASLLALVTNMAPTTCAPGINLIAADLEITSSVVSTLAITLCVLGLGLGPMVISPLSEVYGRLPVYHVTNLLFILFTVGNALVRNTPGFIILRFLAGFVGGTPLALGGGTIADVTTLANRSAALGLFSLGALLGPVLGPLIGGFIAGGLGWRFDFWILAALDGAISIAALLLLRETNPKILLERKTSRLRAVTGNTALRSKLTHSRSINPKQVLIGALVRPTKMLFQSPILLVLSFYVAFIFGTNYLLFTTFPAVFEGQYGFTVSTSGLAYLGLGAALFVAIAISRTFGDRIQAARMKAHGVTQPRPQYRLLPMIYFSPCVGFGLIIYGWTAAYKVQWIVPIIGTFVIGVGSFFVLVPTQLYLVDLFGSAGAASALGASNLARFLASTFLPLAGPPLYKTLGYGFGNTLLGLLALAFLPAPVLFYKYGERLQARTSSKLLS
ncbi:fluconazole resistance protein 1 [Xylariaceae sp. AK1471]|nr:fluconazole resistance protein 1 [Xylariaceae sp. AK1471]